VVADRFAAGLRPASELDSVTEFGINQQNAAEPLPQWTCRIVAVVCLISVLLQRMFACISPVATLFSRHAQRGTRTDAIETV